MAILATTAKANDGVVSRWLNRPVSRRLSAALLKLDGIRPVHATMGTAGIAAAMFLAFLLGGPTGAVAGGLLFHAASVCDGVDGEIARATWRSSAGGARLDTMVDVATNILFVLGLTLNLAERHAAALPVGLWSLALFVPGVVLLGAQAARTPGTFSLDLLKHDRKRPVGRAFGRLMAFLTAVTSRDFFALLFAVLILAGLPMAPIWIFATAATLWFPVVVLNAVLRLRRTAPAR
jgi:CDP-L-myo-inositol myo-inositolphosphotransferase